MDLIKILKPNIDLQDFFLNVNECNDDVYFVTSDGTRINLKSMLSQIIFQVSYFNTGEAYKGHIYCSNQTDYQILDPFFEYYNTYVTKLFYIDFIFISHKLYCFSHDFPLIYFL